MSSANWKIFLYQGQNVEVLVKTVLNLALIQPAFTCSKLTTETLEQGVKYVQS